jgi:hypothetical protein
VHRRLAVLRQAEEISGGVAATWISLGEKTNTATEAWRALDPKIRASDWTPEQETINAISEKLAPVMMVADAPQRRCGCPVSPIAYRNDGIGDGTGQPCGRTRVQETA